jgi:acyl carrier protein
MNNETLLNEITKIFGDILDVPNLVLTHDTTALDIEEWDSITRFNIKFLAAEIQSAKNVGDIVSAIQLKIG